LVNIPFVIQRYNVLFEPMTETADYIRQAPGLAPIAKQFLVALVDLADKRQIGR